MTVDRPSVGEVVTGIVDAINRRSWLAFENLLDPGLVMVDRRPFTTWGTLDREGYIDLVKQLPEWVPDVVLTVPEVVRLHERGGVLLVSGKGTSVDGIVVEFAWAIVGEVVGGCARRLEYFEAEDVKAAVGRFEEFDRP